jgi:hypothetical protein
MQAVAAVITDAESKNAISMASDGESWAIYWYLCGSDLESNHGFASGDLKEMMEVDLSENITFVIQAGGSREWENGLYPDVLTRCVYDVEGFEIV